MGNHGQFGKYREVLSQRGTHNSANSDNLILVSTTGKYGVCTSQFVFLWDKTNKGFHPFMELVAYQAYSYSFFHVRAASISVTISLFLLFRYMLYFSSSRIKCSLVLKSAWFYEHIIFLEILLLEYNEKSHCSLSSSGTILSRANRHSMLPSVC